MGHMPVIPALGRPSQEEHKFKASLGHISEFKTLKREGRREIGKRGREREGERERRGERGGRGDKKKGERDRGERWGTYVPLHGKAKVVSQW